MTKGGPNQLYFGIQARYHGCLPFTKQFRKFLVGMEIEHDFLGHPNVKFPGETKLLKKVVIFFCLGHSKWKSVFHLHVSHLS